MDKAKAYDEALEKARQDRDAYQKELDKTDKNSQLASILRAGITAVEMIFPQLKDSDDERIRKELIEFIKWSVDRHFMREDFHQTKRPSEWIAYLEKQKYDRMQPVYDNQESFESALDKAWKAYNDCGSRTVDSCEDDYIESAYAKGFREGYLFGLEKQKEQKPSIFSPGLGEVRWNPLSSVQQKPVDDKAFEEWINDWWKHNKVNNPDSYNKGDEIQFDERGFKNFCRGIKNMYQQKPDWSEDDEKIIKTIIGVLERDSQVVTCEQRGGTMSASVGYSNKYEEEIAWLKDISLNHKKFIEAVDKLWSNEWSEEDEKTINDACCFLGEYAGYIGSKNWGKSSMLFSIVDKLKSLHPSWKPSKKQMDALKNIAYGVYQNGDGPALRELHEQLLKLGGKKNEKI